MTFPWRNYSKKELLYDFEKLKEDIQEDKITDNKIKKILTGYKSSNNFFQKERMSIRTQNKKSCKDFWKEKKDSIIAYQKKYQETHYKKDLFSIISYLNFCPAQFQPYAAGMIYKYFKAKKVFDPYAGWGDRCIAAMAMNIDYIGCDNNIKLRPCYEKMLQFYKDYTDSHIEMFFDKTEKLFKTIPKGSDLLFSSPPFFDEKTNIVEEYNNFDDDYVSFMEKSLLPIIKMGLKAKIPVCLYIPENMYKYIINIIGKAHKKFFLPGRPAHKDKKSGKNKMAKSNIIYCWV
jgi:hypothetical protein